MSAPDANRRLESWKEIAAYLGKTVRTTQRWEAEGLPVRREVHGSRGYIFAYTSELDAWLAARQTETATAEPSAPVPAPAPVSKTPWALWAGTCAITILIAFLLAARSPRRAEPVWVLVAAADNRSGNQDLDSIPLLLSRDIGASPGIYAVPQERLEDTLRLMRKDPATAVDDALAREICQRDGGIQFVLHSRIVRSADGYGVTLTLVNVSTGRAVASSTEPARKQNAIPDALHKMMPVIWRAAGDGSPGTVVEWARLQRVTTPSLSALRLYTQSFHLRLTDDNPWPEAEQSARAALDQDPDFAAAHIWLAWCIRNQRGDDPEAAVHVQRALALSATATDHEQQWILASRFSLQGEDNQAISAYRHLLSRYPDDFWARSNLAAALARQGRSQESAHEIESSSDLRPNDPAIAREAFWAAIRTSDGNGVRRYEDRLTQLEESNPGVEEPRNAFIDRMSRLHRWWLDGKLERIPQELAQLASNPINPAAPLGPYATIVQWNESLGRLKAAAAALESCPEEEFRAGMRAINAYYRDDAQGLQAAIGDTERMPLISHRSIEVAVLASGPDWNMGRIRQMLLRSIPRLDDSVAVIQAHLAALNGDIPTAVQELGRGAPHFARTMRPPAVVRCAIARAQELAGADGDALQTLEAADTGPVSFFVQPGTSTLGNWHRIRYERARILRKLGRNREAEDIERTLRSQLRLADSDHPILVRLNAPDRKPFNVY